MKNNEFYIGSNKIHFVIYYVDEMLLKYYYEMSF